MNINGAVYIASSHAFKISSWFELRHCACEGDVLLLFYGLGEDIILPLIPRKYIKREGRVAGRPPSDPSRWASEVGSSGARRLLLRAGFALIPAADLQEEQDPPPSPPLVASTGGWWVVARHETASLPPLLLLCFPFSSFLPFSFVWFHFRNCLSLTFLFP